jgi:hypothetical protein
MRQFILAVIVWACCVAAASAECSYNGKAYPTGTKLGPYTCQSDGTWR